MLEVDVLHDAVGAEGADGRVWARASPELPAASTVLQLDAEATEAIADSARPVPATKAGHRRSSLQT